MALVARTLLLVSFGATLASCQRQGLSFVQQQVRAVDDKAPHNSSKFPNILVIAADHGEGTSMLSHALGAHPCMIDVGEPFGADQRWYSPKGRKSLLTDGGKFGDEDYSKLQQHLDEAFTLKGWKPFKLQENLHKTFPHMLDFFIEVQKETCLHAVMPKTCRQRCVFVLKLFPSWVTYDYTYVDDFLRSEKVMVLQSLRNEADVINSNKERFNMGDGAIAGLKTWNVFLNKSASDASRTNIWTTINMNSETFASPAVSLSVMRPLFPMYGLSSDDSDMAPVLAKIEECYIGYAVKREKASRYKTN